MFHQILVKCKQTSLISWVKTYPMDSVLELLFLNVPLFSFDLTLYLSTTGASSFLSIFHIHFFHHHHHCRLLTSLPPSHIIYPSATTIVLLSRPPNAFSIRRPCTRTAKTPSSQNRSQLILIKYFFLRSSLCHVYKKKQILCSP